MVASVELGGGHRSRSPARPHPQGALQNGRAAYDISPPTVSAVIPTLNEAANIGHVIERIPPWVDEIIVVDGDSTDGTAEMAKAARDDVVVIQQDGRGKGDALSCGFARATC